MVRVSLFKSIDNYSEKMTAKNLEIETCGQVEFSILSSKNTDSVFDKFCWCLLSVSVDPCDMLNNFCFHNYAQN